jgi:hypothetical protein
MRPFIDTSLDFEHRLSEMMTGGFVRKRILPLLPEYSSSVEPPPCGTPMIRGGLGRTVEYRIGEETAIFAKLYSNRDLGEHAYSVLEGLRKHGFATDQDCHIPEPLSYSPEDGLLITRGVKGVALISCLASSPADLAEHARKAARCLIKLHGSSVRFGSEGDSSAELLKMSNQLIKAIGHHPHEGRRLLLLTRKLRELAKAIPSRRHVVQTHGRFRHAHVFLESDSVSVMNWDKSCPSDPAIDVADFLHLLRRDTFRKTKSPDRADRATRAFLEEYSGAFPQHIANLAFFWGLNLLTMLCGHIKDRRGDDPAMEARILHAQKDFEDVMEGRFLTP